MKPLALLLLLALSGCTSARELNRPGDAREFLVACGAITPWTVCHTRADELCPNGYETISEKGGFNRKEMRILCP